MRKKAPIWELLVERGLVEDRHIAESWVMAGKVLANGLRIDKPGQPVPITDEIVIKGINQRYVGKGGLKLEGALADFGIDVAGLVAIDAGASTGGFTDCLLQHGAAKVYAVDVGYGRLVGKLQIDERVVAMEKVNIGDPTLEQLDPRPTFATVDLSYLSLRKAIPIVAGILHGRGRMVCLVKPFFEVPDSEMRRTGVIEDPGVYSEVLADLAGFVKELGYRVMGISHSHVTGNKGAREFFIGVDLDGAGEPLSEQETAEQIAKAVESVMGLDVFRKDGGA